jgi:hypothetical protein
MHTWFGIFPKRFPYITGIFAGKLGWNDNDLFVGTEQDIDVVSVDINDSSISTSSYIWSSSFCITVPVKNYF